MSEELKIVALVKFNENVAVVFNRSPNYIYEKKGDLLYAIDGPFVSCFQYEEPSIAFKAFAGREFELPMKDGTVTKCNGQWWDKGIDKLSGILNVKLQHLTMGTVEKLKKCYVFSGTSCNAEPINKMISEYKGCIYPYWDYEKVIKYDDLFREKIRRVAKLEKDKRHLVNQCKSLSNRSADGFKAELLEATGAIMHPHIEGVYAVWENQL